MKIDTVFIYTLSDDSGVRYIGKSKNPKLRFKKHLKECRQKITAKEKWIFSLLSNGKKPVLEILEEIVNYDWQNTEIYWISQFKVWGFKILNGTSGGEGSDGFKGKKHSKTTKLIMREKALLNRNRNAKLNKQQIQEIKKLQNLNYKEIGKLYGVSSSCVWRIKTGKCYTI